MVIAHALRGMWWLEPAEKSVDSHVPSQTHSLWRGYSAIWSLCLGLRGFSPEPMLEKALHITDTHTNLVNTQMLCHSESHSLPITLNIHSLDWDEHYLGPREMLPTSLALCP